MPGDPDLLYDSITAVPDAEETIVGLQRKLLYMLNLFQQADARPTAQARETVAVLQASLAALEKRWREAQ